jgi:hypothetical protein
VKELNGSVVKLLATKARCRYSLTRSFAAWRAVFGNEEMDMNIYQAAKRRPQSLLP